MQLFYSTAAWLARYRATAKAKRQARQERAWATDPLSHPALSHMSPHELADLPLERALFNARVAESVPANVVPLARPRGMDAAAQGC